MSEIYKITKVTDTLNAIEFDNKTDIRIRVCYPEYDESGKQFAVRKFWDEFERLSINSNITNEK